VPAQPPASNMPLERTGQLLGGLSRPGPGGVGPGAADKNATSRRRGGRRLTDTNNDADGWPIDGTIRDELALWEGGIGRYEGDYIGDGATFGDQITGGTLDRSIGGDVYGWGLNDYGQIGDGFKEPWVIPNLSPVLRGKNVTLVAAGAEHSVAVSKEGAVFAWGRNQNGQLGLSDAAYSDCVHPALQHNCDAPRKSEMLWPSGVAGLWGEHVVQVSATGDHNLAVTRSGHTYAWGNNEMGQLGTGDTTARTVPTRIPPPPFPPVLTGQASSLPSYLLDKPRPSPRTYWTSLVPPPY